MPAEFYDLNSDRPTLTAQKPLFGDDRMLTRAALVLLVVMTVWRFYIGLISHVIWEEGHFVVSGAYFALGYPDIPAGYPWIARVITSVFGWHVWPLRLFGLIVATAIPFGVWFMAKPVTSERNAVWAAIISLLLPPSALNGTIFYPEGGLQLLLVLMLGCLLRALTSDSDKDALKWWIWAGVCAGLGQLVHFRFLVPGLAVVIYMLANPQGRTLWRKPGPYITAAIAALGLVPALVYNGLEGWPAIQFHVINRPRFDPSLSRVISFFLTQFAITTPLFFIALTAGGKRALLKERDTPGTLLGYQAAVMFVFYVLQTLVNKKVMPHWPFMAYLPLLPYVPGVLIAFADKATTTIGRYVRLALIATGPLLALAIGIAASIYQWEFRHSAELPPAERAHNILQNENYSLAEPDLAAANARAVARFGPDITWATTGHRTAVHLEFPADGDRNRRLYTLGEPYDTTAQFVVARRDWGLDFDSLIRNRAGKGVVLILNEPDYLLHEDQLIAMYEKLCASFDEVEPFRVVSLPPGRVALSLYTARVRTQPLASLPKGPCPFIPQLYLAHPDRGDFIDRKKKRAEYFGMASDPIGIRHVDIMLDHKVVTAAGPLKDDPNVHAPDFFSYDPNYPKVQFNYTLPDEALVPGEHVLSMLATRSDGTQVEGAQTTIYVKP